MDWKLFLSLCREVLGKGYSIPYFSESWCSYTTFTSLEHNIHYWSNGLPDFVELLEDRTQDGGLWRQEFFYADLAHIILPRKFYWEYFIDGHFTSGYKLQDINLLARTLERHSLKYRKTDLILEVKLY